MSKEVHRDTHRLGRGGEGALEENCVCPNVLHLIMFFVEAWVLLILFANFQCKGNFW